MFTGFSTAEPLKKLQWLFFSLYIVSLVTSMSGMELFSTLLVITFLARLFLTRKNDLVIPPWALTLILFTVVMWLGIILSDASTNEKWYDFRRARFFFIYFFLFWNLFSLKTFPWMKVLMYGCLFVCLYGTVQHFWGPLDWFRPEGKKVLLYAIPDQKIGPIVVGTFNHHLTFSGIFLLHSCVLFSIGLSQYKKNLLALVLGAWLFLLCIWSESRAAWFAVPICILIIFSRYGLKKFSAVVVSLFVFAFVLYQTDSGMNERFKRTFFSSDTFYSINDQNPRVKLWKAQLEMLKDHIWIGVGWNNNERKSKEYLDKLYPNEKDNFYGHAHSSVLQILASTGLIGFTLYALLWAGLFKGAYTAMRSRSADEKALGLGILAAFIGFHIQGLTQWNFGDAEVLHNLIFYWAVLAHQIKPSKV